MLKTIILSQTLIANKVLTANKVDGIKGGDKLIKNVENYQKLKNCLSQKN